MIYKKRVTAPSHPPFLPTLPQKKQGEKKNKARYMATLVACGWAGAVLEKVTRASVSDAGAVCSKSSKTPKK